MGANRYAISGMLGGDHAINWEDQRQIERDIWSMDVASTDLAKSLMRVLGARVECAHRLSSPKQWLKDKGNRDWLKSLGSECLAGQLMERYDQIYARQCLTYDFVYRATYDHLMDLSELQGEVTQLLATDLSLFDHDTDASGSITTLYQYKVRWDSSYLVSYERDAGCHTVYNKGGFSIIVPAATFVDRTSVEVLNKVASLRGIKSERVTEKIKIVQSNRQAVGKEGGYAG